MELTEAKLETILEEICKAPPLNFIYLNTLSIEEDENEWGLIDTWTTAFPLKDVAKRLRSKPYIEENKNVKIICYQVFFNSKRLELVSSDIFEGKNKIFINGPKKSKDILKYKVSHNASN